MPGSPQAMALKAAPNTGMAVTVDIGNPKDIHPRNKQDVGKRLALQLWIYLVANGYNVPSFNVNSIPAGWSPSSAS